MGGPLPIGRANASSASSQVSHVQDSRSSMSDVLSSSADNDYVVGLSSHDPVSAASELDQSERERTLKYDPALYEELRDNEENEPTHSEPVSSTLRRTTPRSGHLFRNGPDNDDDDDDDDEGGSGHSASSSSDRIASLPQHEQLPQSDNVAYVVGPALTSVKLKNALIKRLQVVRRSGRIQSIDLSRRGLSDTDALLIRMVLRDNPQLSVLKLGHNLLGDRGAGIIASSCKRQGNHHTGLSLLDLGFNNIGDEGCQEIALHAVAGNYVLKNLGLSGNRITETGAVALATAMVHGCSLVQLDISANKVMSKGIDVICGAVAELDSRTLSVAGPQGRIPVGPVGGVDTLKVGSTWMGSQGVLVLSQMLAANRSLRVLCLSDNKLADTEIALLSQALARSKETMPLESISLSFNQITDTGVEYLMNAIWGSKTLKEIALDNNLMQDRGAQLCAVVLEAIALEKLDIGFNRVSTVGIKTMMKSLCENESLRYLGLCGLPLDQNASKAVCYALAYNQSLEEFHVDSCCIGHSGQRHIIAGIVSNRYTKLKAVTGFDIGPITKTLGLPQIPEDWGNDRVLSFVRFMWAIWNQQTPANNAARGPAPPANVAASGKNAFTILSSSEAHMSLFQQEFLSSRTDESPLIEPDMAILVRSESGTDLQIPQWNDNLRDGDIELSDRDTGHHDSTHALLFEHHELSVDQERVHRNLQWLRSHLRSLDDVGSLLFNNADLWQLHQYFFSPAYVNSDESESEKAPPTRVPGSVPEVNVNLGNSGGGTTVLSGGTSLGQELQERLRDHAKQTGQIEAASPSSSSRRPNKRMSLDEEIDVEEPSAKRAKNLKPRIAYFPRIREKLESLGTKPPAMTLALLRQLKYIETVFLEGKNIYTDEPVDDEPGVSDVEMILLDLL
eukprot:Nitzschia sp. Nitz4//scaffold19_size178191//162377//165318//NITZ4_002011-RA/size178191-processed-gene-0.92-mRNA-1//-1//CDS//3329540783//3126//frame0